ncbi:Helix-turn-helix domain [Megamonas hypermegale]|jgi:hypothetical protein|uniref:Helix-turn-helix domain n=2 Tax=Megamonas TaxID=158846 RepID=A0A378NSH6_9FIRM|nr:MULTISPECIES: helix-turn-helix domain-containing protein [Megamonas]STY71342.1 Helix-turn-helix domain [Megamonas hypermegale]
MQIEENEYILNYLTETFGIIRNYIEQQSEENKTLKNIINNTNKEVLKRVSPLGLVSASDAALLLGVKSKNTIYSLMDQHILPEVNINSLRMIHIDDIKELIKKQRGISKNDKRDK